MLTPSTHIDQSINNESMSQRGMMQLFIRHKKNRFFHCVTFGESEAVKV